MSVILYFTDPINQSQSRIEINSLDQLRLKIAFLQEKYSELDSPIGIDLERNETDFLSIGLGDQLWVLIRTIGEDQQFCSLGDKTLKGATPFYLERWTEIPQKWLVPANKAWRVVEKWLRTGELSDIIDWTTDNY